MTTTPTSADTWRWTDEERLRDRPEWGPGPWDDEPDKVSWTDEATGRPCLIVRNRMGSLCGYAAVDPGHPLHGVHDGDDRIPDEVEDAAHGGLTFTGGCAHSDDESHGICHVPKPGQPDDVWWFGFDCGHFMDYQPGLEAAHRRIARQYGDPETSIMDGTYRTVGYVVSRCQDLAAALAASGGV